MKNIGIPMHIHIHEHTPHEEHWHTYAHIHEHTPHEEHWHTYAYIHEHTLTQHNENWHIHNTYTFARARADRYSSCIQQIHSLSHTLCTQHTKQIQRHRHILTHTHRKTTHCDKKSMSHQDDALYKFAHSFTALVTATICFGSRSSD